MIRSADYIEAIIFNISTFINGEISFPISVDAVNSKSNEYGKLSLYLGNKLNLTVYLLQFCAVSSQIKNHQVALSSAQKALSMIKNYCEELYEYEVVVGCEGG